MDNTNNDEHTELLYKVLVVGDIGAGKTSLIKRYVHNVFSIHYKSTIGVDFALKVINWDDNTHVRLQLWDLAGQERFSNMTRVYYKDAVAAFVVFDITRISTFDAAKKWKADIDAKVHLPNSEDKPIPVILLANKIDLIDEDDENGWMKTDEEMDAFCRDHGFVTWFNISARNNLNIGSAVNKLVEVILEKVGDNNDSTAKTDNTKGVDLNKMVVKNDNQCCNSNT